jgi:hypothetical protein
VKGGAGVDVEKEEEEENQEEEEEEEEDFNKLSTSRCYEIMTTRHRAAPAQRTSSVKNLRRFLILVKSLQGTELLTRRSRA